MIKKHSPLPLLNTFFLVASLGILAACSGGSSNPDPDNLTDTDNVIGDGNNKFLLSALVFDRDATFLPLSMIIDSIIQFTAVGTDDNGNVSDISNEVVWSSSDSSIANVDQTGKVTAISVGEAQISAEHITKNHTSTVSHNVVVKSANLAIYGVTEDFMFPGDTIELSAIAETESGSTITINNEVNWSVSNTEIATISANRLLTIHSAGSTSVSATFHGLSATINISVGETLAIAVNETGLDHIIIEWTDLPDADTYTLTIGTVNYFGLMSYSEISGLTSTVYEHEALLPSSRYQYQVRAIKQNIYVDSEVLGANTLSNNSAVLNGDVVGNAASPENSLTTTLRKTVPITVANSINSLQINDVYITRLNELSRSMRVIIPVESISDRITYCGTAIHNVEFRSGDGNAISSPLSSINISYLQGNIRSLLQTTLSSSCVVAGAKAYFLASSLFSLDTFQTDFDNTSIAHTELIDSTFTDNESPDIAIIPQSYIVIPPTQNNPNQRIEVVVANLSQQPGTVSDISSRYILLDQSNLPLYWGSLRRYDTWDGVLNPGESNTLYADINYSGYSQSIEFLVKFDH